MSASSPVRIRAFVPYPSTAPSSRFRVFQFVEPLSARGVELDVVPFYTEGEFERLYSGGGWVSKAGILRRGLRRRKELIADMDGFDGALVLRELGAAFNPGLVRRLEASGVPFAYDFDDAVFLHRKGGSRLMRIIRRPKEAVESLCRGASRVLAGNRYLADFARMARGGGEGGDEDEGVVVHPTVVDTDRFVPGERADAAGTARVEGAERTEGAERVVVGWIGTHTTTPYLTALYPAFARLAQRTPFVLRVVSNRAPPSSEGFDLEYVPWEAEREVEHVQELDIGLYPLDDDPWTRGKCGFKAIQYLACGVPTVASPVGVLPEIVVPGDTGLLAGDPREWVDHLERLIGNPELRRSLGRAGRKHVVERYSVAAVVDTLEAQLRETAALG